MSKIEEVTNYIKKHNNATRGEVAEALGWDVPSSTVTMARKRLNLPLKKGPRAGAPVINSIEGSDNLSKLIDLAKSLGGMQNLKNYIASVEEIAKMI